MICTCTMNPALDYFLHLKTPMRIGGLNRGASAYYRPAGKGINVSIVLNHLQIPSRATGFLGGFTRDYFITLLQEYPFIEPNFTYIQDHTRINVKLQDMEADTEINAGGPAVSADDMRNLREKVLRLGRGDYFVLAGTSPETLDREVMMLIQSCAAEGVRLCLDMDSRLMAQSMGSAPFLAVRRMRDFQEKDGLEQAEEMHRAGAKHVLLLDGDRKQAWLVFAGGTWRCRLLKEDEKPLRSVGTADALMAGFIADYLRSNDALDSFRFACRTAGAMLLSNEVTGRETTNGYEEMQLEEIKK